MPLEEIPVAFKDINQETWPILRCVGSGVLMINAVDERKPQTDKCCFPLLLDFM